MTSPPLVGFLPDEVEHCLADDRLEVLAQRNFDAQFPSAAGGRVRGRRG
ncbi:hypothetical protein [Rhodococcus erythropolis]|nr:hypothetical protein [Rhodococcus erythropolis]